MKIKACLAGSLLIVGALLSAQAAFGAAQSTAQQKCILKMNKDATKVLKAQMKESLKCIKEEHNDATGSAVDLDLCIVADSKSRISKKKAKTKADDTKFCSLSTPDFGYSDPNSINNAAIAAGLNLMEDLFGDPNNPGNKDPNVYPCDPNLMECRCQRFVTSPVSKLMDRLGKDWGKCKKSALKNGKEPYPNGAATIAELQACVDNPLIALSIAADTSNKLGNRVTKIGDAILKGECNAAVFDPFGGTACSRTAFGGTPTDVQLRDCLKARVYCRFCQMINVVDAMTVDCDLFDNATADSSCQ